MGAHPTTVDVSDRLLAAGVQASAQRLTIGEYVLFTEDHPSADEVIERLEKKAARGALMAKISRATVYNTLNLFVEKGLLRELIIEEGHVVFDPRMDPHHHFLDTESGEIVDVPFDAVPIGPLSHLDEFKVDEVQIVLRGTRKSHRPARGRGGRRRGVSPRKVSPS